MEENKQLSIDGVEVIETQTMDNDVQHRHHHHHSGHYHHHGHHRRHYHRSNFSRNKTNKFVAFLKKHRSVLINILSCTVSVVLLIVIALNIDISKPSKVENNHTDITQSTIRIETSIYPEKILIVSDAISHYMSLDM